MAHLDELRLMTRVARMYYEQNMRQSDIAGHLGISQATVSRLFTRAKEEGIVRITVSVPSGVYTELEEQLIAGYGLQDAIVVDASRDDDDLLLQRDIGSAAAYYLESTLQSSDVIGLSSWSGTLLAMVEAMHPLSRRAQIKVVQILGGVGNPSVEHHATHLTRRLADLVNGTPVFLPAPGIVGSEAARGVLLEDGYVREAMALFERVTLALVGIGSVEPSGLLATSGNIFIDEELNHLREQGAVGDILLRFFDWEGKPAARSLDNRVVGMTLEQLRGVRRAVGVAGGRRKYEAIRGALWGRHVNILITDRFTAERLVDEAGLSIPQGEDLAKE